MHHVIHPAPLDAPAATAPDVVRSHPAAAAEPVELQQKRVALAGQWRTPPTPFFARPMDAEVAAQEVLVPPSLPHSTEDYAKALQDAYRRGAEAAARAAALGAPPIAALGALNVAALGDPNVAALPTPPPIAPTLPQAPRETTVENPVPVQHHPIVPAPAPGIAAQRSVSLPDMSSYAAQQEDEKRQKRLARNRASARLRRLRKKNLVDAYEVEVGRLETTLAQLQQHAWGASSSSSALAEALSMDRGQQKLTVPERHEAAKEILQQQWQFVKQLEELMQEQWVLQQVASGTGEWPELQDTLQLSNEQCQQILEQAAGWHEEWNALQTVKTSLQAMKDNNWLWNEGCSTITDQFLSILHSNQISKFLLWADHNSEAIEELEGVHAIPVVADAPVFQFGMDNNPNSAADLMDEESKGAAS
jgi:hypothetical protein